MNVLVNVADSKSKEKAGGTVMEDIRISVFRRFEETEYDADVGEVPEKHVMRCGSAWKVDMVLEEISCAGACWPKMM